MGHIPPSETGTGTLGRRFYRVWGLSEPSVGGKTVLLEPLSGTASGRADLSPSSGIKLTMVMNRL